MIHDRLNTPIFITGIERSGNSMIARILNICGVFIGKTESMYENMLLNDLNDKYYYDLNIPANGQYPMPEISKLNIPVDWNSKVQSILIKEEYNLNKYWLFKDSRLCQIWPVWDYAFPNAKWVIVRRNTDDIIQSCLKTAYMNAFENKEILKEIGVDFVADGWKWWIQQHEKRFVEMIEAGLNCKVIWPERMVHGDYKQIYEMVDWLGLQWNSRIVTEIDPLLENSRQKKGV